MSSDLLNCIKMVSLPYFCETEQLVLQNEPVKFHFMMKSVDMQLKTYTHDSPMLHEKRSSTS